MNKIGFNIKNETVGEVSAKCYKPVEETPVRSVVTVRFDCGREYPYYNDKFNLKIGDKVFVDGKLYGKLGVVADVTTRFKVSRSIYKDVIAKLDFNISGSFKKCGNYMLEKGVDVVSKQQIISWFVPPYVPKNDTDKPEIFLTGEGYSCKIGELNCDENIIDNAFYSLENDELKAVVVNNGEGTAVIEGNNTHVVEFKISSNQITDIYCDCVSPHFCKHCAAMCILLSSFVKNEYIESSNSFFAVNSEWFFKIIEDKNINI